MNDHSDVRAAAETLGAVAKETIAEKDAVIQRLERENELLRARIAQVDIFSDDLADAARDRERDSDFARSEDYQARGERD